MLLYLDSFDHYVTADLAEKWTTTGSVNGGSVTISSATGRRSSNSLRLSCGTSTNATFWAQKGLTPSDATAVVGFAIGVPAGMIGASGIAIASLRDVAVAQLTLRLNQDLSLSVIRGPQAGGTVLGTSSAGALAAGVVAYLEWKALIHLSAGTVEVRVNGVSLAGVNLTGQNTRNTATAQYTSVIVGHFESIINTCNGAARDLDVDDLYVCDGSGAAPWNTFLGDCRVDPRVPTAAGATTGWTPSTGANWQNVDDAAPNDDTDYNTAASAGVTDTFVVQDAPVVGATIYGIQHCLSMKKTDAGVCTVAPVIRHAGVDNVGAALAPGTTYAYGLQIAATNPGTGAAWVEADFNNAEFGYRRTS